MRGLRALDSSMFTETQIAAFRAQLRRDGDCLVWTGAVNRKGYGMFRCHNTHYLAHRVAYALTHGHCPTQLVLHTCDNPPCCEDAHHFLGDVAANRADAEAKGRKIGPSAAEQARGVDHGHAKLSEADVLAIRASRLRGVDLADAYHVSPATISLVRNRKLWRHLP